VFIPAGLVGGEDAYDFFQKGGTEKALQQLVKDPLP
jgi:hypothetical protein